ncbi:MAG: hypothetical protein ACK559_08575, partial [bacterium]
MGNEEWIARSVRAEWDGDGWAGITRRAVWRTPAPGCCGGLRQHRARSDRGRGLRCEYGTA